LHVREHPFLAATGNVDYNFERARGHAVRPVRLFIDKSKGHIGDGVVWLHGYRNVFEKVLAASPYLAVAQFTCADIMATYCVRSPRMLRARGDMPNAAAHLERIAARPAYQRAMAIAGEEAEPPAGADAFLLAGFATFR
jgi:glutathione S-transferase